MLETITFLLNPKLYLDEKFLELKCSLNDIINSSVIEGLKTKTPEPTIILKSLNLLGLTHPKANVAQLENMLSWMIDNTKDVSKFPVIIKKINGANDILETWKSLIDWVAYLEVQKDDLLLQDAAEKEEIRVQEKNEAIAAAEKDAAQKKAVAEAALTNAAIAAQQAQLAMVAADNLKK